VALYPEEADGQASERGHDPRRVAGPDQGFVFLVGERTQWSLFSMCARSLGGRAGQRALLVPGSASPVNRAQSRRSRSGE